MKITIFGVGYVGLVTAACLADVGHEVTCVDTDEQKIAALERGSVHIFETGLEILVERNLGAGRLVFTHDSGAATKSAELIFIAVGTPPDEDGAADLSHVLAVARTIGKHIDRHKVVVAKSTVPVGTGDRIVSEIEAALRARGEDVPFDVCSNPEFLKEGSAIEDFTKPARIIVGTDSEAVGKTMRACYAPYNRNHDKMIFMDRRSAELTKYAANAMLATKISFMSEIANLAERLGADIEEVRKGIGSDPRIGYHFIYPGCGFGGSCFPKDIRALVDMASREGLDAALVRAVETVNTRQKTMLFRKLEQAFAGDLAGKTIAVWGLSFKPNTDDMRDAPSRTLLEALWRAGARVRAYDPKAMDHARRIYGGRDDFVLVSQPMDALKGADALAICTEWKQFRIVDFGAVKSALTTPVIVDGRNLYDPTEVRSHGLLYYAVGRGDSLRLHPANGETVRQG